jgi:hypothetical protein
MILVWELSSSQLKWCAQFQFLTANFDWLPFTPSGRLTGPSIRIGAGYGILHPNRSKFHEGDMERGVGKPSLFDGTNYTY